MPEDEIKLIEFTVYVVRALEFVNEIGAYFTAYVTREVQFTATI